MEVYWKIICFVWNSFIFLKLKSVFLLLVLCIIFLNTVQKNIKISSQGYRNISFFEKLDLLTFFMLFSLELMFLLMKAFIWGRFLIHYWRLLSTSDISQCIFKRFELIFANYCKNMVILSKFHLISWKESSGF